jgi:hypothetical protein
LKDNVVAEKRCGYNIMSTAFDSDGNLCKPALIEVAEEIASYNLRTDISVLKTEIRLYYEGRHFFCGCKPSQSIYWISCNKKTITYQTVDCWKKLGNVKGGHFFETSSVAIEVDELCKLRAVLECITFN